jgi:cyclophilin family peptidyl-prolyl cis-trans isomerase
MIRARLLVMFVLVLAVGGCSLTDDDDEEPTATSVSAPVESDIASGCWTAESRTLPLTLEGDRQVPQWKQAPEMAIDVNKTYVATVNTNHGSFEITFFPKEAPKTVNNFVCLARAGFYDNTTFHRIVSGFVIQGGDPEGTGRGGPGYRFEDEPVNRGYGRGIVAMANAGPNTNGSQFFVCLADVGLPPAYTIFGEVTKGMDVVDKIAAVPTRALPGSNERSSPTEPVTVSSVTIAES